ncbi:MAG: hypothetical protein LBT46_06380 [Planctomycetaceae bacterium]|jgi:hypothetical protein|nr:hypothetical protein [Planctomycetaceae bacterium]
MNISLHAKQRLFERYEILFSRKEEKLFCRMIENGRKVFTLKGGRKVCFFQGTWLLFCIEGDTVKTFYPPSGLTAREKTILNNIGTDSTFFDNESFHNEADGVPAKKKCMRFQEIPQSELPDDFHKAEEMLESGSGL